MCCTLRCGPPVYQVVRGMSLCDDLILQGITQFRDSAGSHFSAVDVVSQGTALRRDHEFCTSAGDDDNHYHYLMMVMVMVMMMMVMVMTMMMMAMTMMVMVIMMMMTMIIMMMMTMMMMVVMVMISR